jgi:hypothetical protein
MRLQSHPAGPIDATNCRLPTCRRIWSFLVDTPPGPHRRHVTRQTTPTETLNRNRFAPEPGRPFLCMSVPRLTDAARAAGYLPIPLPVVNPSTVISSGCLVSDMPSTSPHRAPGPGLRSARTRRGARPGLSCPGSRRHRTGSAPVRCRAHLPRRSAASARRCRRRPARVAHERDLRAGRQELPEQARGRGAVALPWLARLRDLGCADAEQPHSDVPAVGSGDLDRVAVHDVGDDAGRPLAGSHGVGARALEQVAAGPNGADDAPYTGEDHQCHDRQ